MTNSSYRISLLLLLCSLGSCMVPLAPPDSKSLASPAGKSALQQVSPELMGGTFSGWLGGTSMESSDWEPLDQQFAIGFDGMIGPISWPVRPEFGFQVHGDSATIDILGAPVDVDATFFDVFIGVGKRFSSPTNNLSFTVGGGFALTDAEVNAELFGLSATMGDTTTGFYLHGGPAVMVGNDVELGLDARFVFASDFDFGGAPVSANSASVSLLLRVIF